ncbi:hypothetical protein J6590_003614 [Homalodisca vitripennis]|nr:hypothetical protein J6590_003614 [Homalodisca vitripennis]
MARVALFEAPHRLLDLAPIHTSSPGSVPFFMPAWLSLWRELRMNPSIVLIDS